MGARISTPGERAPRPPNGARWGMALTRGLRAACLLLPLALACVSDAPPTEPPDEIKKYILDKLPDGEKLTELNVNFEDKLTLLGAQIEPGLTVEPGQRVKVTMYWRADKPLEDPEWKLFTHVLDGSGERLMNIDNVGPLRHIRRNRQTWPPGGWVPGKIYVDNQSFTMPRKLKSATVQVVAGIWKGKERLAIKSGPSIKDNRALVATLSTGVKPEQAAQGGVPQLEVAQLKKGLKVRLDGRLNEDAWKDAAETPAFVNVATGQADPASPVQGSAKLLWDENALYLGVMVKDQNLVGGFDKAQKDPHLWTKDCVEIMIDPDGDGDNKDYYEIQVNPQNLVFDSHFEDYNRPRKDPDGPFGHEEWSSKLESAVKLLGTLDDPKDKDEGYQVELRIPWASFDKAKKLPPQPGSSWRVNLYAMHDNQGVAWSPILGQGNFHKAARFGRISWVTERSAAPATLAASTEAEKPKPSAAPESAPAKAVAAAPAAPAAAAAAPPAAPGSEEPAVDDKGLSVSKKALQQAPAPAPGTPSQPGQ